MDIAIDWRYWLIFPKVKEWEAVALSLGIDPENTKRHPSEGVYGFNYGGAPLFADSSFPNPEAKIEFQKRRRLLEASLLTSGFFPSAREERGLPWQIPIRLAEFAAWAAHVGLSMPAELRALIAAPSPELSSDLFSAPAAGALSAPGVAQTSVATSAHAGETKASFDAADLGAEAPLDDTSISIPGKMPTTGCGRVAVETAWLLECEDKLHRRPTAKEVMARLMNLAKSGERPDILREQGPDGRSVEWVTGKGKQKNYPIEALEKTLEAWGESRA